MLNTLTEAPAKNGSAVVSLKSPTRRAAEWLAEQVARGKKEPFAEAITLTPEIAEILLTVNDDNRPKRQRLLDTLITDAVENNFELNGETIKISKDGRLNDGQHRCESVIRTGKPIRTFIVFGVTRDSRLTVDTGVNRTVGDFIAMDGGKYATAGATVAKNLCLHRRGATTFSAGQNIISKTMIRQEYWNHEKEIITAVQACDHKFSTGFGMTSLATAYVLIARKNPHECAAFFAALIEGAGLRRSSAVLSLRNRIINMKSRGDAAAKNAPKRKNRPHHKVEMVIRYWNAHRKGVAIKNALPILGDGLPAIEG